MFKDAGVSNLIRTMNMTNRFLFNFSMSVLASASAMAKEPVTEIPKLNLPTAHTVREIEGWKIRVDDRLLNGDHAEMGKRALKALEAHLVFVTIVVPEKPLAQLRKFVIQVDFDYGGLKAMQYHPGEGWLRAKGYSADLVKCVHIPEAKDLLSAGETRRMPWVVLHELAHAFHDQVLGFEESRVKDAWKKFRDSGKYKSVPTSTGGNREHYGVTNQNEFFAEMTESFFGSNDFFPFVPGELKSAEPEIYALMEEIWSLKK